MMALSSEQNDPSVQPKQWKSHVSFGTWNVRHLYRSGSLMTTVRESAMYKLDLVGVQEVRWDKRHTAGYGGILFSMQKGMKIINWEQDSFVH